MASVSTPTRNSAVPSRATSRSRRWRMVMVVTGMVLVAGVVFSRQHLAFFIPATAVLMTLAASSFWYWHLQSGGLPRTSSFLLAALLAGQSAVWFWHHPWADGGEMQAALGCAGFTYAMLWVFEEHHREAGLRSLATAALLLSIGILAKPPVLVCCGLLTLVVFFDERRRAGGLLNSGLLLLTPVLLCTLGVAILRLLAVEGVAHFDWSTGQSQPDSALPLSSSRQMPSLPFCAAVLTARLLMRKTASSDLAFLFLVFFLPTLGMARWMPRPLSMLDVSTILSWAAACLLALDPPIPKLSRLVVLGGACLSLSLSFYFCH